MINHTSHPFLVILFLTGISWISYPNGNGWNLNDGQETITDTTRNGQIKQVWTLFAKAILNNDSESIKALSADCINCPDCLTNTPLEDSLADEFRKNKPNTWYGKLYKQDCYIPIDDFIKKDLAIIFNDKAKSRLLDKPKLAFVDNKHNAKLYKHSCIAETSMSTDIEYKEVLLTVIDPSPKHEGGQKAFAFIKTHEGFKFCGFSTIP